MPSGAAWVSARTRPWVRRGARGRGGRYDVGPRQLGLCPGLGSFGRRGTGPTRPEDGAGRRRQRRHGRASRPGPADRYGDDRHACRHAAMPRRDAQQHYFAGGPLLYYGRCSGDAPRDAMRIRPAAGLVRLAQAAAQVTRCA